jgi:hypothetical protein
LADYVGPNVTQAAQKALSANQVEMRLYANQIAQFFEHAKS